MNNMPSAEGGSAGKFAEAAFRDIETGAGDNALDPFPTVGRLVLDHLESGAPLDAVVDSFVQGAIKVKKMREDLDNL